MFKLIARLTVFVFILSASLPAFAFTPDDVELTSQLHKSSGALSSWEAEMSFPEYQGVTVKLWYSRGNWRQQWQAGDKAVAVGTGPTVKARCVSGEFPLSPMFVWLPPNPVETWKAWGVDNATSSYGFCDGLPCYLFGTEPGDETSAAVILNNEDMSPLTVRYPGSRGMTTINYSEYKTFGGFPVPQKVVLTVGTLELEARIKWVAVNRADDPAFYDPRSVDSTPCATPPAPFDLLRDKFRYPLVK